MDRIIKNYEDPLSKPMNTKEFFNHMVNKFKIKTHEKKHHQDILLSNEIEHVHDENCEQEKQNIPPKDIVVESFAIVIDDVVVDVMNVAESFGQILSREPKFIKLSKDDHRPLPGWIYTNEEFKSLDSIVTESKTTSRF
jgi:hypothetical protein